MQGYVLWLIAGLVLVTVEMATGTFYLLVLGVAAFAGSAAAYGGMSLLAQVLVASVIAVIGVVAVNRWRELQAKNTKPESTLDIGQPVQFEAWINEPARLVRVKYRGSSWDAHLIGDAGAQASDILYICGAQGSQLQVSRSKPA
jgi:membrane protein implicated in regulation of membrane protease activity